MQLLKSDVVKHALASDLAVSFLKKTIPPLDKRLLKLTRGWVATGFQSVVLLRTRGAKSGQLREIVTLCMPVGPDLILVGSNWGQDRDPAWVHNLRAHREAQVTFRGYQGPMIAREIKGRQRAEMWQRLVRYNPQYARYQEGTDRLLPVMLLQRQD
ncbi:MAG: nitroreductase family deazaflavin-dependent oxidoreductase [Gammaproteobacteria bacterium]|nr:nitroreductase family deazaflavin-dependent oxidoreductase [Gammaproteobacteria bacterium]